MIATLGLSGRVTLVGRISDDEMLDHYARCRAVCFTPVDEDYGFVTVEAFASRKGVLTCVDSGGPADLVRDGDDGPRLRADAGSPGAGASLASWTMRRSPSGSARAAATRVAAMTWSAAVERLVIV